jgi:hypothetical protein
LSVIWRPEVPAVRPLAAVTKSVLDRCVAIGVRVSQPVIDLYPLVKNDRVIIDGHDRSRVGRRESERMPSAPVGAVEGTYEQVFLADFRTAPHPNICKIGG